VAAAAAAIWTIDEAPAVSAVAAAVRRRTAMGLASLKKGMHAGTQYIEVRQG